MTFEKKDIDDHKLVSALGYIGILCLLPLLTAKDSPYAQYNGKQGLLLFLAEIVVFFVNVVPILGQIVWFITTIFFISMSLIGAWNAWQGRKWELPILGKYVEKVKL